MIDLAESIARTEYPFDGSDEIIGIDALWDINGRFRSLAEMPVSITAGTIGSIRGQQQIHLADAPTDCLGSSIEVGTNPGWR